MAARQGAAVVRRWLGPGGARRTRQERAGLLFVSPVMLATVLVLIVPTTGALLLSMTDFDIYGLASLRFVRFVGLSNYVDLLGTSLFWRAVVNTLLFTVLGVPLAIATSLGTALLVSSRVVRWKPLWRLMLFAPYVTTLVATAVVWRYIFDARTGLLNYALSLLGLAPVDWLGDPAASIPAVTLFVVWKVFGYNMLVFMAALAAVPTDLMDAARLDGAGPWARFRHVTLPAIGPALLLAGVSSVANFLQIFTEPYVMTHGGPAQRTVTVLYFMFQEGFEWWSLGTASAVAVILFACVLGLTAIQIRLGRRAEWL
jgi:ABC-type sugar transport system permease subunit